MADLRLRVPRLLLWLALLLTVGLGGQAGVVAHQARARGLPSGFPAPVGGADVDILGVNAALGQYDGEPLEAALARIAGGGFVWVRQSFYWSEIEPQPGRFDWAVADRILAALARHPGLRLVAALDDKGGITAPLPPPDSGRFAKFAGAFAARYGAQVDYYQVWDEPNLAAHWGGGPVNPPAYADLLARTARAIREADPSARILLAGLAPTVETGPQNLSDVRYLEQLYQAGAAPYFDIVAGKPYGFDTGPGDRRADEAVLNFSRLFLLREVMERHGDAGKPVWASHWGWNALPGAEHAEGRPGWTGAPSIWGQTDEATQADRTVAALRRARAEWPWVGALILDHFQPFAEPDDPRWGFALVGPDGAARPVYDAVAGWAAALPDAAPVGGYPALNPWATYEGDWRVGPLGADVTSDGGRATFRFDGPSVALTVRRGPYRAFLYVTVDGQPANGLPRDGAGRAYVVLYDGEPAVTTVPLATGLPPGPHTVEVVTERGQGQWSLVDWRVGAEPIRGGIGWKIAGLAVAGLVLVGLLAYDARRVDWAALGQRFLGWPEWAQMALTVALTLVLWATAGASWGWNWGSPWFVVSLSTLPVLGALFALRPDLGLALVALTAPFYLHPGHLLHRALSLPEVLVVLCGVGMWVQVSRGQGRQGDKETGGQGAGRKKQDARGRGAGEQGSAEMEGRAGHTVLDWTVVLLVAAAVVAGLAAAERWAALFELRAVFLLPALYYGLLRVAHLDGRGRQRIVDGWVLGAVGVALVGLVQYMLGRNVVLAEGGLPRLQSVYYSPNNVGLYLGRVWPLLAAVAVLPPSAACSTAARPAQKRRRVLFGMALVVVTLALGLSFSRGALLLGLPAALCAMGWRVGGRWRWVALALVLIGALALIPLLRVPRFASMFDLQRGSTFFRLELWRSSLALVREHPWFGVGPGNFPTVYRTRYVLPSAWREFNLEHPHNVYLDHWTRLGILGVLAGGAVQVAFWRALLRRSQPSARGASHRRRFLAARDAPGTGALSISIGLAGSMAALLAHGLVDNTLFFPDLALIFFLMLALTQ
jgi:O-antigen ligase